MLRSVLLIATAALFCGQLLADKITTTDDAVFEGIVSEFVKDKRLALQTGYGRLTFELKSIKFAEKSEYKWSKAGDISKPTRSEDFEAWVKQFKGAPVPAGPNPAQPKENLPRKDPKSNRSTVPGKKDDDELDCCEFCKRLVQARDIKDSDELTAKEKREKFNALGKKWAYATARIEKVEEDPETGNITITLARNWYDSRTGVDSEMTNGSSYRVVALKDIDGARVDEINSKQKKEDEDAGAFQTYFCTDYKIAENLKVGDGIVFKITLDCTSGAEVWSYEITRYAPSKNPIAKGK